MSLLETTRDEQRKLLLANALSPGDVQGASVCVREMSLLRTDRGKENEILFYEHAVPR
jgi:hypothetical protein